MILFIVPQMFAKTFVIYDFALYQYLMGRAGQTMDPKVIRNNGRFMIQQYQKMLAYRNKWTVSQHVTSWIDFVLSQYAQREIVSILSRLKYSQAKTIASLIKGIISEHPDTLTGSKQVRRFLKWSFLLFFSYEKLRDMKNLKA